MKRLASGDNLEKRPLPFLVCLNLPSRLASRCPAVLASFGLAFTGDFLGELFVAGALGKPDVDRKAGLDCGRFNYRSSASRSSGTMR